MEVQSKPGDSRVKVFTVFLANKVGALLEVVKLLHEHHIMVLGFSIHDSVDMAMTRMVVSDPERVHALFEKRGVPYGISHMVVVELSQGAAGLAACLSSLLIAEINIYYSFPLLTHHHGRSALAFLPDDDEFAISVLQSNGYKILDQTDLSR